MDHAITKSRSRKLKYSERFIEQLARFHAEHSRDETKAHFNLTESELRAALGRFYTNPKLRHLRKVGAPRPWDLKQLIFVVQRLSLLPTHKISAQINRSQGGIEMCIARLGFHARHLHGMRRRNLYPLIKMTKHGHGEFISWVELEDLLATATVDDTYRHAVSALARFQRWIFQVKDNKSAKEKLSGVMSEQ